MRKKLPNPLLMPNEVLPPHCDANLPSSRAQPHSASNVTNVSHTARISNDSTRTPQPQHFQHPPAPACCEHIPQ